MFFFLYVCLFCFSPQSPAHPNSKSLLYTYTVLAHVVRGREHYLLIHAPVLIPSNNTFGCKTPMFLSVPAFHVCFPLSAVPIKSDHSRSTFSVYCPLHLLWSHQLTSYSLSPHSYISSLVFFCNLTLLLGALSFTQRFSAACFMRSVHMTVSSANILICFLRCPVLH